jgi:hypothetical protein
MNMTEQTFELLDGEVRLWVDQDALHIIAGDLRHNDPAELTSKMARKLAFELERLADIIDA